MQRSRRKFGLGTLHQKSVWFVSICLCQPAARHYLLDSLIKDKKWNLFIRVCTYMHRLCMCTGSLCALKFFQMSQKTLYCILFPPLLRSLCSPPSSFIFSLSVSLHFPVWWLSLDRAQDGEPPLGEACSFPPCHLLPVRASLGVGLCVHRPPPPRSLKLVLLTVPRLGSLLTPKRYCGVGGYIISLFHE